MAGTLRLNRGLLLLVLAGSVLGDGRAHAQLPDEIPRDSESRFKPVQRYPLIDGGALLHNLYGGGVHRVSETDKEVARTKVPKASAMAHTLLVLSRDQSRVLVLHHADQSKWPAQSHTIVLDGRTLKRIVEWPLGRCDDVRGWDRLPAIADRLTLLCQESQPPDEPKQKPTLAVVALDLTAVHVVSWSPLGGDRHGQWFGPMFFGYTDDTDAVAIDSEGKHCPSKFAAPSSVGAPAVRQPWRVFVLRRSNGEHKGEVWFLDGFGMPARRVATLTGTPVSASICAGDPGVLVVRERISAFSSSNESIPVTFDLATGAQVR